MSVERVSLPAVVMRSWGTKHGATKALITAWAPLITPEQEAALEVAVWSTKGGLPGYPVLLPGDQLTSSLVPRTVPGRVVFCTLVREGAAKASASFLIVPREDNPYCCRALEAALNTADALAAAIGGAGLRDVRAVTKKHCAALRTLRIADVAELDAYVAAMPA